MATRDADIQIRGLNETVRSLEKFGAAATDLKAAFRRIGSLVVNRAAILAPRRTGLLASTIKPSNTRNKSIVRAGSAAVPYAGVIHYGWQGHGIEPHPFLTTAIQSESAAVIQAVDDEIRDLIRTYDLHS